MPKAIRMAFPDSSSSSCSGPSNDPGRPGCPGFGSLSYNLTSFSGLGSAAWSTNERLRVKGFRGETTGPSPAFRIDIRSAAFSLSIRSVFGEVSSSATTSSSGFAVWASPPPSAGSSVGWAAPESSELIGCSIAPRANTRLSRRSATT